MWLKANINTIQKVDKDETAAILDKSSTQMYRM